MTEMQEKALEIIGQEQISEGTPESDVRDILMGCAEYSEEIAEKIANQQTPAKTALRFMKGAAKQMLTHNVGYACVKDDAAVALILESVGIEKEAAQSITEGGLMYALIKKKMEQWEPHRTTQEQESEKIEPSADISARKAAVDFSMEDLGL